GSCVASQTCGSPRTVHDAPPADYGSWDFSLRRLGKRFPRGETRRRRAMRRRRPIESVVHQRPDSALPRTYSSQGRSPSVHPLPHSRCCSVPCTITGSPTCTKLNSQRAFSVETLVQPCETLRRPWSHTDHGAAWMYSPPFVVRIVQYTVTR